MALVGFKKSEVYRRIQAGIFPKPHRESHKVAVWFGDEIDAWLAERRREAGLTDLPPWTDDDEDLVG